MPDFNRYSRTLEGTHRVLAFVLGLVLVSACSDRENSVQPVQRAFKLAVPSSPVTIFPGREIRTNIVIERLNGFVGRIELQASDVPNGMTATILPSTGGIAVLVLNTSPAMPTGPSTLTIVGTASGAEAQSVNLVANVDIGTFAVVAELPVSVRTGWKR